MQGSAYQQMRGLLLGATGSDRQPHSPKIVSSWFLSSPCSHLPDRHCHVMQRSPLCTSPLGARRAQSQEHATTPQAAAFSFLFFPLKPSEIEFWLWRTGQCGNRSYMHWCETTPRQQQAAAVQAPRAASSSPKPFLLTQQKHLAGDTQQSPVNNTPASTKMSQSVLVWRRLSHQELI